MREVQLLVAGAVAAVPFAVYGWVEEWPIGACATVVIVLYGVCGWLALRARRAWQAEVAEARRRKRAGVVLSGSWPRNVRVLEPSADAPLPTLLHALGQVEPEPVVVNWMEDDSWCRECGEKQPGHLGSCSRSAMRDPSHPFHEARP